MIPVFHTTEMVKGIDLLVERFRCVLVNAAYYTNTTVTGRIRLRSDDLKDHRVYFAKIKSQIERWNKTGGALITWEKHNLEGPHDAIFFVEAPPRIDIFDRACQQSRYVAVIYRPPTWRMHEETLAAREYREPRLRREAQDALTRMIALVEGTPRLTPRLLDRLKDGSPRSYALESPAGAERSSGTARGAP